MEKLEKVKTGYPRKNFGRIKGFALALGLALGTANFSYSQNMSKKNYKVEQTSENNEKGIKEYETKVQNRDKNITTYTTESLDEFANRIINGINYGVQDNEINLKINDLKNILCKNYSKNIGNDEVITILKNTMASLAQTEKYRGLSEYIGNKNIDFVNGLGYVQYVNNLPINYKLSNDLLDILVIDLGSLSTNGKKDERVVHEIKVQNSNSEKEKLNNNISKEKIEKNNTSKDYDMKVKNRDSNITTYTTETLEQFSNRLKVGFFNDANKENSLLSKKIGNIKEILNNKFEKNIVGNDPIFILESALECIANNDEYIGLKQYTDKFSGNFDINFVNAYGYIQYKNDWTCNWNLSGKSGELILQDIIDILENFGTSNKNGNTINNDIINKNRVEDPKINGTTEISDNNKIPNKSDNIIKPENKEEPNNITQPDNSEIVYDDVDENYNLNENVNLLSQHLMFDKLNGVDYEDVWNMIDGIKHEGLKNAVLEYLLRNDVIGAQKLLGMDVNCNSSRYPNYVASRKLGQRELELMEKYGQTRRLMDKDEILSFMEKVERAYEIENYEVKTAYLKFLSGEFNNGGLPYCIISKYDYKIYLFSADHKLLSCQSVLTGAHIGNHPNNPKGGYHTTPGGMYEVGGFFDKSSEGKNLVSVYGTDYILFLPLEGQYVYSNEYTMGMHGYVKGRENRLTSQNSIDHRVSNGCINLDRATFGEVINLLEEGSKVYICKDDE